MKLLYITEQSEELNIIKNLYHKAFPKNERMPFWFLLWKTRQNNVEFLGLYDDVGFVGFVYLIHDKDITFIFYLAICENMRSKNYGTKTLELLKCRYVGNRIVLNVESPCVKSKNQHQREKRKNFYLKNGFFQTHFNLLEANETYEVLANNKEITIEEYHNLMKTYIGKFLYILFKPKLISQRDKK